MGLYDMPLEIQQMITQAWIEKLEDLGDVYTRGVSKLFDQALYNSVVRAERLELVFCIYDTHRPLVRAWAAKYLLHGVRSNGVVDIGTPMLQTLRRIASLILKLLPELDQASEDALHGCQELVCRTHVLSAGAIALHMVTHSALVDRFYDDNVDNEILDYNHVLAIAAFTGNKILAEVAVKEAMKREVGCYFPYPLQAAILSGHLDIVEMLLEAGLDPSSQGVGNDLPLTMAAARCDRDLADLLLRHGANINARSSASTTALTAAIDKRDTDMVRYFLDKNADPNGGRYSPLYRACKRDTNLPMIELLLERGSEVDGLPGQTPPLHAATGSGSLEVTKLLLARGAQIDFQPTFNEVALPTPLGRAVPNHEAMVQYLLEAGANPNLAWTEGNYPLLKAAESGAEQIVRLLLKHGAIYSPNPVLCRAVLWYHEGVVRVLLARHGTEGGWDRHVQESEVVRNLLEGRWGRLMHDMRALLKKERVKMDAREMELIELAAGTDGMQRVGLTVS